MDVSAERVIDSTAVTFLEAVFFLELSSLLESEHDPASPMIRINIIIPVKQPQPFFLGDLYFDPEELPEETFPDPPLELKRFKRFEISPEYVLYVLVKKRPTNKRKNPNKKLLLKKHITVRF